MSAIYPGLGRTSTSYRCLGCVNEFHPLRDGDRLYCGNPCRTRVVSARGRVYKRVEQAAKDGTLTAEEIVATLRAIPRDPILVEHEEEGEDG